MNTYKSLIKIAKQYEQVLAQEELENIANELEDIESSENEQAGYAQFMKVMKNPNRINFRNYEKSTAPKKTNSK